MSNRHFSAYLCNNFYILQYIDPLIFPFDVQLSLILPFISFHDNQSRAVMSGLIGMSIPTFYVG